MCNFWVFTIKTAYFMALTISIWLSPLKLMFKLIVSGANLLNLIEYGKGVKRIVQISNPFSRIALMVARVLELFEHWDELGMGFLILLSYLIPFYISAVPLTNL